MALETAQQLRVLAAFSKTQVLFGAPILDGPLLSTTPDPKDLTSSSGFRGFLYLCADNPTQTHTYTKLKQWARKMVQWLKALIACAEDPD